jgi:hypothetical protein
MRGRVLLTFVGIALCAAVTPAHAAARASTWIASSNGTRVGAVELRSGVELPLEDTVNDVFFGRRAADSVIRMKGRYGGIIITDRGGGVVGGLLRYADASLFLAWGHSDDDGRHVLAPGHYWATVFGDGPVRVALPVRGGADRAVSLTRRVHAAFTDQNDDDLLHRTLPVGAFDANMTIGPRTVYVVFAALTAALPGADIQHVCLDAATRPICEAGHSDTTDSGGVGVDRGAQLGLLGEPGQLPPPGAYTARYRAVTVGATDTHALFTATIDVP